MPQSVRHDFKNAAVTVSLTTVLSEEDCPGGARVERRERAREVWSVDLPGLASALEWNRFFPEREDRVGDVADPTAEAERVRQPQDGVGWLAQPPIGSSPPT